MKYADAKFHYNRKKFGKCYTCTHSDFTQKNIYLEKRYFCNIRDHFMINAFLGDKFVIKFCKYYEEE